MPNVMRVTSLYKAMSASANVSDAISGLQQGGKRDVECRMVVVI